MKILGLWNHFRVKSLNSPDLEISISRKNLVLTLASYPAAWVLDNVDHLARGFEPI
jgi:hypothetical protein